MTEKIEVLIAEDSRIQAKMLRKKLEAAGYTVRWAENGKLGIEMTKEQRPAIIISDIEMPEMTGYEFCESVKSDGQLKTIPFILLSTLSDAEDIIRGLHVGADNYVTKPYDPEYLLSRVSDLLSTPLGDDDDETELQVKLAGKEYTVKAGKQQVLNLLVSTFENAVGKNRELVAANQDLSLARDQLKEWNKDLAALNSELENKNQKMAHDLAAAAKIQQSLLPSGTPDIPSVQLAWTYSPCDELAGDFLNFFPLDDRHLAAFVVDVSGHGVASSLLAVTVGRVMTPMVSSSSLLVKPSDDESGRRIVSPAEVAYELNNRFPMEDQGNLYFTMVYGVLDKQTQEFKFVSAGHPNVVHVPAGGKPKLVETADMAIGWIEDTEFEEHSLQLAPGDRIYLYSDGVPEAMDHDLEEFGDDRMLESLTKSSNEPVNVSTQQLLDAVHEWCVINGPKDDVSILGIDIVD
ncbi:fused response regulator/phosphatase [bacterium]|jgi:phosphoserine phosphatase RsbU/P|nr:SpoIIE family protein phosphatase [Rubripirellula sp.]MDA7492799.1 fused response regulator/phosphatase [bacterium]MDB4654038.1 fused response regulator/phosphatase [bacterium]MDB4654236.1 fused response regulator/phosphatase [Rubripirellula sp.]